MDYQSYIKSAELAVASITDALDTLARDKYEEQFNRRLVESLPHKHDPVNIVMTPFMVTAWPDTREIGNFQYNHTAISERAVCENTFNFIGVAEDVMAIWNLQYNQRYQVHDYPQGLDKIDDLLKTIHDYKDFIFENPQLDDFVKIIQEGHNQNAARILDTYPREQRLGPGGDHELSGLFRSNEVSVVYQDEEIALLKPVFQSPRVTMQSEPAYVVGVDDTPTGLFGHVVDGTHLDPNQTVSRQMIHRNMGFDINYEGSSYLTFDRDVTIRVQGDLAMEKVSLTPYTGDNDQCNVPIDNHLIIISNGRVTSKWDTEPVHVIVGDASINILHDEHKQVNFGVPPGVYTFSLLPRGIQDPHLTW